MKQTICSVVLVLGLIVPSMAAFAQPADEAVASPVVAEQESQAAFDEANATAHPGENQTATKELAADQNRSADTPSYGSFLDQHREEPESKDIMETGDKLVSSVFTTAAYLCLILGIIFFAFWLLRRFGPRGIARGRDMINPQLVGRLMLGQKKHVDVIRVQGRTLLLGVTEENVRLLTELDVQPGQCFDEEDEDEFTDFTEMLGKQAREADDSGAAD